MSSKYFRIGDLNISEKVLSDLVKSKVSDTEGIRLVDTSDDALVKAKAMKKVSRGIYLGTESGSIQVMISITMKESHTLIQNTVDIQKEIKNNIEKQASLKSVLVDVIIEKVCE